MRGNHTSLKKPVTHEAPQFYVVHPLDDQPEQKFDVNQLGPMRMTGPVRLSLIVLRAYLIGMGLVVGWRVLELAGVLARHPF